MQQSVDEEIATAHAQSRSPKTIRDMPDELFETFKKEARLRGHTIPGAITRLIKIYLSDKSIRGDS